MPTKTDPHTSKSFRHRSRKQGELAATLEQNYSRSATILSIYIAALSRLRLMGSHLLASIFHDPSLLRGTLSCENLPGDIAK